MTPQQTRIVIVGAGFSGLATAVELQERLPEAEITLQEMQQRADGMVWSEQVGDYLVEHGPITFPGNRLGIMKLCQKLGLTPQLRKVGDAFQVRWILHHDGVLHRIPGTVGAALTSPLFGMGSAYRIVTERLRPSGAHKNKLDESVLQFAERRFGQELGQIVADAAATEVFAGDGKAISVRSGFPLYARAEQEHGSVLGGLPKVRQAEREAGLKAKVSLEADPTVHYGLDGGLRTLVTALEKRLRRPVSFGTGVQSIQKAAQGMPHRWLVRCNNESTLPADCVILTCPAYKQAGIVAEFDAELADQLLNIPYAGIVRLVLGYLRSHVPDVAESHSLLVPQRFKKDILRIAFPSSYLEKRAPADIVQFHILMGGWARKEMLSWEDDTLIVAARRELRNLLRITKPPKFFHLLRQPRSMPQYTLGHSGRVEKIEERVETHRGLFLGGIALHGITLTEAASTAERVARRVRDEVKSPL